MTDQPETAPTAGARERKKEAVRARIIDEAMALVGAGEELNHDAVAARAEVARRTVYRYFPDREALLQAVWMRVNEMARRATNFPETLDELLASIEPALTGFDRIAPLATLIRTTPQGRAVRLSQNTRRKAAYTKAAADLVKDLPKADQALATAMLQVLNTSIWLEMRDHWGLDGKQIARASRWAIRTLIADLKARRGLPLDQDLPERE